MINLKDVVKKERAKMSAAGDPGNGKTPAELKKEILENRKAILESAVKEDRAKAAKEPAAKDEFIEHETKPIPDLKEYSVKPVTNPNIECPFCGEEKSPRGMGRHIKAIHEVPGVTVQDLNDVEKGLKSLPDLVAEKFEGPATIVNLSPEVEEREFSDWFDVEEDPEDPEENPEEEKLEDPEAIGPEENGAHKLSPAVRIMGGIAGGLVLAAIILPRIDPRFKEITDKLLATLGGLGSKESTNLKKSFGQHAADLHNNRGS